MSEAKMPEFKLNRTLTHISKDTGLVIHFEKGVPRPVHVALIREVIALGAERLDDEQGASFEEEDTRPAGEPVGEERESLVFTAFEELVEKNSSKDFMASGVPKPAAVKSILGFQPENAEITKLWMLFQARKSAES